MLARSTELEAPDTTTKAKMTNSEIQKLLRRPMSLARNARLATITLIL
jgi:hypothetical protein